MRHIVPLLPAYATKDATTAHWGRAKDEAAAASLCAHLKPDQEYLQVLITPTKTSPLEIHIHGTGE